MNIHGQPVDTTIDGPLADGEWMKQNLARAKMALPNGYCGLPLQKSCPHANALYLTCPLFVTTAEFLPQHRKQLDDTRALIAHAEADGHTRMVEMNRAVETNLLTNFTALDADRHDCQCTPGCSETGCGKESSDAECNSHHLVVAAQRRRDDTLERARRALHDLHETGQRHTITEIAARAGVSR